jgi:hypothetical protein
VESRLFAAQLIQANPASLSGYINGLAYAILGIPSVLYGILMIRRNQKLSGIFLSLNGVFCITGIIGYLADSRIISAGVVLGGILFLLALLMMTIEFRPDAPEG